MGKVMNITVNPEATSLRTLIESPELAPMHITKRPKLLSVRDAKAMSVPDMTELFKAHVNPGQLHFMKLLGFHKVKIESAEGMYYIDQHGRRIMDFFGGFGSLAFGPDHFDDLSPPLHQISQKLGLGIG